MTQLTEQQQKYNELFKFFCTERDLDDVSKEEVERIGTSTPLDDPGIMLVFFNCGHSLITSFTNYGVLLELNTSRTCSICNKFHWFNKAPIKNTSKNLGPETVDYVAARCANTRKYQNELLYALKPVKKPLDIYSDKEKLIEEVYGFSGGIDEIDYPERSVYPDYKCDGGVGVIYALIKDDCMMYIGSTTSLERRWVSSIGGKYSQSFDGDVALIMKMTNWENNRLRELQEIERRFIRHFKTSEGLGYNVMGGGYTRDKYVLE